MTSPTVAIGNSSVILGTTAVLILPKQTPRRSWSFYRVYNVSPANGGTVWLTRFYESGVVPAPNAAGCFPLAPGQYELFRYPDPIPSNSLWGVATAAGTILTVECG